MSCVALHFSLTAVAVQENSPGCSEAKPGVSSPPKSTARALAEHELTTIQPVPPVPRRNCWG